MARAAVSLCAKTAARRTRGRWSQCSIEEELKPARYSQAVEVEHETERPAREHSTGIVKNGAGDACCHTIRQFFEDRRLASPSRAGEHAMHPLAVARQRLRSSLETQRTASISNHRFLREILPVIASQQCHKVLSLGALNCGMAFLHTLPQQLLLILWNTNWQNYLS